MSQQNKLLGDLTKGIEENNSDQDNDDLDNIRVLVFKKRKLTIMIATSAKPTVKKLLTAPNNMALEKEKQNR